MILESDSNYKRTPYTSPKKFLRRIKSAQKKKMIEDYENDLHFNNLSKDTKKTKGNHDYESSSMYHPDAHDGIEFDEQTRASYNISTPKKSDTSEIGSNSNMALLGREADSCGFSEGKKSINALEASGPLLESSNFVLGKKTASEKFMKPVTSTVTPAKSLREINTPPKLVTNEENINQFHMSIEDQNVNNMSMVSCSSAKTTPGKDGIYDSELLTFATLDMDFRQMANPVMKEDPRKEGMFHLKLSSHTKNLISEAKK